MGNIIQVFVIIHPKQFSTFSFSTQLNLDFKIMQRHALLARTIGTKAEEESSHTHSHNLVISATASMVALCSLEAAAYFLYNRKVSIYPTIQYCWQPS